MKILLSLYPLQQLHCCLAAAALYRIAAEQRHFLVAAEPRQGRHSEIPGLAFPPEAALALPGPAFSAMLKHHRVYLSEQSPFAKLLICKLQESEAAAALHLSCSRSGGAEPEKS